ncbi:hypothetical protein CH63R_13870 [Colletotrichum higginsianum IMI 349063]|uniref:Uncharacterized protein n=2 Tax=Colletotrichum higginsianum TaxID=80884 RepID=A0A1B7XSE1_COLHI|nr:hypothetical protein CH63R_13870 [Colletotrichum higginsianum IMI 349063]OBR02644.1 hypothetical protein CH63R_13870 [Colletotrichum higginsianum IMI 349063]TID07679.1 hypothetical protein CH35J_000369 [Colletotrichum higginsianum]
MSETDLSVLCGYDWHWDSKNENIITFGEDGSGKLICRAELNVWIAAEFDWKLLGIGANKQQSDEDKRWWRSGRNVDPRTETVLMLEMTLTKRRIPSLGEADMSRYTINEDILTDDAFKSKRMHITLETGTFGTQFDARQKEELPETPKFKYRLTFDVSPYPKRNQWKDPDGAPDAMKFWEWTQFCGCQIG